MKEDQVKYIINMPNLKNCTQCKLKVTDYTGSTCLLDGHDIINVDFKRMSEKCKLKKIEEV